MQIYAFIWCFINPSNQCKPFLGYDMRPAGHNGHKRTGEQHPEALHRWLSEEAAHAFFQRRSLHMVTIANSPTCEPFLLPPDTEIWPPRLHRSFWQSAFSRSARKPQAHVERCSCLVERAPAGARALCPRGTPNGCIADSNFEYRSQPFRALSPATKQQTKLIGGHKPEGGEHSPVQKM